MSIPITSATAAASTRSCRDVQYSSVSSSSQFFMKTPMTSWPSRLRSHAATAESTPPDKPTTIRCLRFTMRSRRMGYGRGKGGVSAYCGKMQKGRVFALPSRQSGRERLLAGARLLGRFLERFLLCLRIGQRLRIALGCVHVLFQGLGLLRSTRDIADFLDLRLFLCLLLALGFFRRLLFFWRHLL